MNKLTAKYLALLALAVALFSWKTLFTNQFTILIGSEAVNLTYGWLHFWVRSLWQWQVPLWDPYGFCGRPFAAEMLPSAFYPLNLLFALVPLNKNGMISPRLFHEYLILTTLLCAYFTFALLREFRLSRFACFAGACCFAMSGVVAAMIWPPYREACIWLPAIFLFLLRAFRAERARAAAFEASLAGLCLGLSILTGGMHFSILQGIFVVAAVLYYGATSPASAALSRRSHWLRLALILGVVMAVAGGAGAVQLLPSFEYSRLALRFIDGGLFPGSEKIPYDRLHPGMWPQSIVTTLFPYGFGGTFGGAETWAIYIGAFPFFLAVTAIWKSWSNLWVRFLTGLSVATFAYSLGAFSPLHGVIYALVPYLWVVRTPGRFLYLVTFALSILAAFGLERLLDRANGNAYWRPAMGMLKWVAIACAAALFVPGVFGQLTIGIWVSFSLLMILGACGWFAWLTAREAGTGARVLLAAFILFDLTAFHWVEASKADASKPAAQLEQMISLRGVADFVKARPEPGRVRLVVAPAPEPNMADVYGVRCVWGGGGTVLKDYLGMLPREDLLNVRYYVKPAAVADPDPIYQDKNWKVFENPKAFPLAWVVHRAVVEASQDAVFRRIVDPAVDLRRVALLEAPLPQALQDTGTADKVRVRSYEANRIIVDVTAAGAGLLVLSEVHYPGWRATVNGKRTGIHRVNGGLRGIALPPGQSTVELDYVPVSFYAGGALSVLTFLVVLSGLALKWGGTIRRKRSLRRVAEPAAAP